MPVGFPLLRGVGVGWSWRIWGTGLLIIISWQLSAPVDFLLRGGLFALVQRRMLYWRLDYLWNGGLRFDLFVGNRLRGFERRLLDFGFAVPAGPFTDLTVPAAEPAVPEMVGGRY